MQHIVGRQALYEYYIVRNREGAGGGRCQTRTDGVGVELGYGLGFKNIINEYQLHTKM